MPVLFHHKKNPFVKPVFAGAMVGLYLAFLVTGLYCRCFDHSTSHSGNEHFAQADDHGSDASQPSHGHDHNHQTNHSTGEHDAPHSNCHCDGFDTATWVSSSDIALAKIFPLKFHPATSLQPIFLAPLQKIQTLTVSSRGPPSHVSIPIKNQALLI